MRSLKVLCAAVCLVGVSVEAKADLFDRGNGLIYDSFSNITWLADLNYAKSSGYDSDGRMTWSAAMKWAADLRVGGFDEWRLPTLDASDSTCIPGYGIGNGYGCSAGELSHLFVTELGYNIHANAAATPVQLANRPLFSNLRNTYFWSSTDHRLDARQAMVFLAIDGWQSSWVKEPAVQFAVAVHPGDIAAVPEPQVYSFLMAGLASLVGVMRRVSPAMRLTGRQASV